MSKTAERLDRNTRAAQAATKAITIGVAGLFIAGLIHVDRAAVGSGVIAPSSKSRPVSHFEGGVVEEILVHDGETVKVGQPIIRLSRASTAANVDELVATRDFLAGQVARLEAEAKGAANVAWPDSVPTDVRGREQAAFGERRNAHEAAVKALRQKQQGLQAQMSAQGPLLARYSRSQDPMTQKLFEETNARLVGMRADYGPIESQIDSEVAEFKARARQELGEAVAKLQGTEAKLGASQDRQARTEITSPVDGIVQALAVRSAGEAVKPGESVAEVVPTGGAAVFDVQLRPQDRKGIQPGLATIIRLSSAGHFDTPLEGKVTSISPNIVPAKDGQPAHYRVQVSVDAAEGVMPGMDGTAHIKLGTRMLWGYLLGPVFDAGSTAFTDK